MTIIIAFILIILIAVILMLWLPVKGKGIITVTAVIALAVLSSLIAIPALAGKNFNLLFSGSLVTGNIPIRIDALSAWFILLINFTCITGALYGLQYMKAYRTQPSNITVHCISFLLVQASLISICSVQHALAFLIAWEIMALSSFMLVIFEHQKAETLQAGINFLIQSHACIMFLTLGFLWVSFKMNNYDLNAISLFSTTNPMLSSIALFVCFFFGFAIKAGFVPFHTWLPYAHPAAPSHISGLMSGVIIKIGIYGILRMLLLIKTDYAVVGYIILVFSTISGIYGVMLAIIQHNLKRLLAYHSIENIGIIGMGIGLGCIGMSNGNHVLCAFGFAGALMHTLNHSLFKSLLFYGAGNVYQATHTMDIEKLGGLVKRMPQTTILFLIAALAICGLPPFNGFVSEFLIYNGLITGLHGTNLTFISYIVCGLFSLALIGGLAILCFTKAFGTVFLGTERHQFSHQPKEAGYGKLIPMYAIVTLIMVIGLFPRIFISAVSHAVGQFTKTIPLASSISSYPVTNALSLIGLYSMGFIFLIGAIYAVKRWISIHKPLSTAETWACGYTATTSKMQFTASSYIRAYRKLVAPFLSIHKNKKTITGVFPNKGGQETHPYDKSEEWFIDYPLHMIKKFLNRFRFLQNGNLQFYVLYGLVFIMLILGIPIVFDYLASIVKFLKQL